MRLFNKTGFFLLMLFVISAGMPAEAQVRNVNPDPTGEPWFVGGDRELTPEEYAKVEEEIKKFVLSKEYKGVKNFPDQMDNSNLPYFPPIFNQLGGSCSQASGTAYHFTYEIAYERGVTAMDSVNRYPSHFTYNFLNKGSGDNGSNYWDGWKIISEIGCPNMATYGGLYNLNNNGWMTGYEKYYAGMHNSILKYYSIDVSTPQGLNNLKAWFYNHGDNSQSVGGIANFSAGASDWLVKHLALGTPNWGDFFIFEFDSTIDHAMTFVGYDDSIRHDFNGAGLFTNDIDQDGDGLITLSDWEIGALIMVNSWGSGWCDGGKAFVPYRHLTGKNHIRSSKVYVLEAIDYYEPQIAMKLALSHPSRENLRIRGGAAYDTSAAGPEIHYKFTALNKKGGDYPLNGISESIEFGLDISKFYNQLHNYEDIRIFVDILEEDTADMNDGVVLYLSVISYTDGIVEYACPDSNVVLLDDATTYLSVVIPGNGFYPPSNFTTSVNYRDINLSWNYPEEHPAAWHIAGYNIYRNEELIQTINDSTIMAYIDIGLEDGSYRYKVDCIYLNGSDTFLSMPCDPSTESFLYDPVAASGNYLYFDGVDDYILTDSINFKGSSFTLEFWAKKGVSYHDDMIMTQGNWGKKSKALHFGFRDDKLYCGFYGDDISTDTIYTDEAWHHYCMTFDSSNFLQTLYRDAEIVATRNSDTLYLGEGPVYIASTMGERSFFRGYLDEIRFWNVTLTQAEIREYMYFPPQPGESGLLAHYRLDEPNGFITMDASSNEINGEMFDFDFEHPQSTLWQNHMIEEDTVLMIHAGYSPGGANLTFSMIYPALCGDVVFDPVNLELSYTPVSIPGQNWLAYDSLIYLVDDGIATDTGRIYINPIDFPVILDNEPIESNFVVSIFPNPASDFIMIAWDEHQSRVDYIRIYSLNGQLINTEQLNRNDGSIELNCSQWNPGIYLIEMRSGNRYVNEKITVVR